MPPKTFLGEFEQMVLLAILQRGRNANALEVRRELEASAHRTVSKGAFYTTLDRLEKKGFLSWASRVADHGRGGLPQRHFTVTPEGIAELRKSRDALTRLWRGLDQVLETR
jgi:DNA-binding PadR family transcriptional regulator